MTGLLISVRSVAEAHLALDGGADLIDIKEPGRGSLGRADPWLWSAVSVTLAGRVPVSAALGELLRDPVGEDLSGAETAGLQYVKLGLAGCEPLVDWPDRWAEVLRRLPGGLVPVAVAYADWRAAQAPEPEAVLEQAGRLACGGLLVDTYYKGQGGLFDHLPGPRLRRLVESARAKRLTVVLAGSLSARTVPAALQLEPDYLAVRGAACRASRTTALDANRLQQLARLVGGPAARARQK